MAVELKASLSSSSEQFLAVMCTKSLKSFSLLLHKLFKASQGPFQRGNRRDASLCHPELSIATLSSFFVGRETLLRVFEITHPFIV